MSEITFVKYCPVCGAENPRQQAFCLKCFDGDLTMVPVEPRRQPSSESAPTSEQGGSDKGSVCILELLDNPDIRFSVNAGQTVGRTEKADVILHGVPKLDWISGAHAKFSKRGNQWYVQHIGTTNFIKVDGESFTGGEEIALYDGSVLTLSLTNFRISFK